MRTVIARTRCASEISVEIGYPFVVLTWAAYIGVLWPPIAAGIAIVIAERPNCFRTYHDIEMRLAGRSVLRSRGLE